MDSKNMLSDEQLRFFLS